MRLTPPSKETTTVCVAVYTLKLLVRKLLLYLLTQSCSKIMFQNWPQGLVLKQKARIFDNSYLCVNCTTVYLFPVFFRSLPDTRALV